ncbi:MAG: SCO family protein [Candidatus Didemnitutus sp.]|nr:SCO family protein [Candidatus Didemnitutus sp.]
MLAPAHSPASPPLGRASAVARAGQFFTGAGLMVFLVTALAAYEVFLLFTIFWPLESGWLGGFVRDFQLWCYNLDPRTGGMSWTAVSVMLIEPLFVVGVAVVLWRSTLLELRHAHTWRRHAGAATAALLVIAGAIAGLVAYAQTEVRAAEALPPFPGERIRVALEIPDVALIDQKGAPFRFSDLHGEVILVTGIYAACTTACPEIIKETRALLADLPADERAGVRVVALTLNPEYETAELMDLMAQSQGFTHPEFRYVNTARPADMLDLLSRLQFSRVRNPETGVIEHVNLFLLVDRRGQIAYRFTLEPRHRAWLRAALGSLLAESR